jgi:cysteinyl-tRNA synthetase
MSCALLGKHFDIHGGGQDLQFPHHENEIAQSEVAHGGTFVNYWMHNGFVRVDNTKMSKSLGNFFTVREILKALTDKYGDVNAAAEVIRYFVVRAHYRSPLNYSDAHLDDAKQGLTRLYTALKGADAVAGTIDWNNAYAARFKAAMDDDFNTPEAVAVLFELANALNKSQSPAEASLLKSLAGVLGLLQSDPVRFLQGRAIEVSMTDNLHVRDSSDAEVIFSGMNKSVEQMIRERSAARKARNFAESDRIRKELLDAGIVLEDKPDGTTEWRRS